MNLVGVYALTLAIAAISGAIGGQKNRVQALKVAAYATTPYWLAGVFAVFPKLEPIGTLLGLYSLRLFALGLASVMKVPRDKIAAATLLTTIAAVLIALVVGSILTRMFIT
jgi:hypothetical protein